MRGKRSLWLFALAGLALCIGGVGVISHRDAAVEALGPERLKGETLVLDAGHGGEDGGAVSLSGAAESGINLSIVLRMDDLLGLYGTCPILLRTEDVSLHDADAETLHEKKASDLKNRVAAVEQATNATLISVHQNTFTDSKYHGAQVFYGAATGSKELADGLQETLRAALDPDNSRQAKPISEQVYLMKHISCRAVLVECGFLSNPEEDRLLQSEAYQLKLAAVLSAAWLRQVGAVAPSG